MTSTVKYPGDARTGRAVAPLYIGPDAGDAGVIVGGPMELHLPAHRGLTIILLE